MLICKLTRAYVVTGNIRLRLPSFEYKGHALKADMAVQGANTTECTLYTFKRRRHNTAHAHQHQLDTALPGTLQSEKDECFSVLLIESQTSTDAPTGPNMLATPVPWRGI